MTFTRIACGAALVASGMLSGAPAMAAGFWLYEMGTPDLGTASAVCGRLAVVVRRRLQLLSGIKERALAILAHG